MINVGDTVKVINKTYGKEYISIGKICRVISINYNIETGEEIVEIVPIDNEYYGSYFYLVSEVEKGHIVWVKDEAKIEEEM